MNAIQVNRSVKIENDELIITKKFAEEKLTNEALKLARKTPTHYIWIWGKTSAVVCYELPKLFSVDFYSILPALTNYCMSYVRKLGLSDNVIYSKFMDNYNRA